jgi:Lrp/AsnC family transcriptional regulator
MYIPDEKDIKILSLLNKDCSISMEELGDKVGLTKTPTWRRVKNLKYWGFIEKMSAILNYNKLGYDILMFMSINIISHDEDMINRFVDFVNNETENVLECFQMTGQWDYLIKAVAKDISHAHAFYHNFKSFPYVREIKFEIVHNKVK